MHCAREAPPKTTRLKRRPSATDDYGWDPDGGAEDDTPDDEHWRPFAPVFRSSSSTTDESGSRQFLSLEDGVWSGESSLGPSSWRLSPAATQVQSTVAQHTVIRPRTDGDYRLKIDPEAANAVERVRHTDVRGDGIVGLRSRQAFTPTPWRWWPTKRTPEVNLVILVDWDRWGPVRRRDVVDTSRHATRTGMVTSTSSTRPAASLRASRRRASRCSTRRKRKAAAR